MSDDDRTVNVHLDVQCADPTMGEVTRFLDKLRRLGATDETLVNVNTDYLSADV